LILLNYVHIEIEHYNIYCTQAEFSIESNSLGECRILHTTVGFQLTWTGPDYKLPAWILNAECAHGAIVLYADKLYREFNQKIEAPGNAMVYLGIKERSERKYTILYISQFDKNSVCFSKKIGIRSLLTGLVQVACFGIVLNYVYIAYLAVIAAYFTQLCLSAVQIIWTWLACSNKKIYIDEYTIEADW